MISNTGLRQSALFGMKEDRPVSKSSTTTPEGGLLPNPHPGEVLREEFLSRPAAARYFGLSEGFFLGLQMDYDLMQRRREIDRDLKTIRPRAA
jgi:antitoxin HigA-1